MGFPTYEPGDREGFEILGVHEFWRLLLIGWGGRAEADGYEGDTEEEGLRPVFEELAMK